jgi:RCC1 and BTB domain-containing protein
LYTDKLNLATEYTVELYNLANMYNVERLKKLCDHNIRKNLALSNAVGVFRAAYAYRVEPISQYSGNFILTHLGALVRTEEFQDLSQVELLSVLKQVPQHCSIDL